VLASILDAVTALLNKSGIADTAIRIVVATGAHRRLSRDELALKLGRNALARFPIECHSGSRMSPTGVQYGDAELLVNATYLAADLKVLIGTPVPHSFAGSSGGAKLVIPGLADLQATVRSHKMVLMGLRRGGDSTQSTFREHIEDLVRHLGVHFAISVVTDAERKTVAVFAGDLVESHRAAAAHGDALYATPVHNEYECLVLNAYPKDTDLIQSENAFVAVKRARLPVSPTGLVVMTTAASEGVGHHGLFEPGGAAYRTPVPPRALRGRELWVYAPSVAPADAYHLFHSECRVFGDRTALAEALGRRFEHPIHCAILPAAPLQLITSVRAHS
jgi:nickel-dependent lactate racemase